MFLLGLTVAGFLYILYISYLLVDVPLALITVNELFLPAVILGLISFCILLPLAMLCFKLNRKRAGKAILGGLDENIFAMIYGYVMILGYGDVPFGDLLLSEVFLPAILLFLLSILVVYGILVALIATFAHIKLRDIWVMT